MELALGESHIVLVTASPESHPESQSSGLLVLFWAYDTKLNTCEHVCMYIYIYTRVMYSHGQDINITYIQQCIYVYTKTKTASHLYKALMMIQLSCTICALWGIPCNPTTKHPVPSLTGKRYGSCLSLHQPAAQDLQIHLQRLLRGKQHLLGWH